MKAQMKSSACLLHGRSDANKPINRQGFQMPDIKKAFAIHLFRKMCEIREFENSAENYRDGNMPGFIHLSIGQEACAVGACAALDPEDYITSTHRGHGHCLAKGADPKRMMAELFARETGYSKGRGGSMHIADMSKGILGANGIVGQSLPLAVGAALTSQTKRQGRVAIAFLVKVLQAAVLPTKP